LSATEIARSFSAVLNRVAAGEEIEIIRNGAPVAVIGPPRARLVSAQRFRELLASAPPVDDGFANELRALRAEAGPPESPWLS
jgi:antitoxin (DNA-binding transcriptional repressor) of toxin-antitoxin stability system